MSNFSFIKESANDQTPEETLLVCTYELGKVIECQHYEKRYGEDRLIQKGYKTFGRTEMSDLISMLRMYCEQRDWDFEELISLGEERYLERMQDLKEKGIKENLKKEYQK
jgi:hypothetical protein